MTTKLRDILRNIHSEVSQEMNLLPFDGRGWSCEFKFLFYLFSPVSLSLSVFIREEYSFFHEEEFAM